MEGIKKVLDGAGSGSGSGNGYGYGSGAGRGTACGGYVSSQSKRCAGPDA